jgi:transcriptional regulator with XRE-family HTH domain
MPDSGSPRLGSQLKKIREERKLTLGAVETLSAGLGATIPKTYLFRVERGKTFPTLPRLRTLAQVYQVKLARLVETLETAVEEQELAKELGGDLSAATFEELRERGIEAKKRGDLGRAVLLFKTAWERAQSESPSSERDLDIAKARLDLSIAYRSAGHLQLAREEAEVTLQLAPIDSELLDCARLQLATIYWRLNLTALAHDLLEVMLTRRTKLAPELQADAVHIMGNLLLKAHPRKAAEHYRSALLIQRKLKNHWEACILLHNLGLAESHSGRYEYALKRFNEAMAVATREHFSFWICKIRGAIGKNLYKSGNTEAARSALLEASQLARRGDYFKELFVDHYYLRRLALDSGDLTAAKVSEASLKYFATRLEEEIEELVAFKREQEGQK